MYCLYFVTQLTTLTLVQTVEFSCWQILVKPHVLCCWLSWTLTVITQSGGRKLTSIMMVAICNLRVEYGHCTVRQTYKNILNEAVNVS
jgi:hypothetical protein